MSGYHADTPITIKAEAIPQGRQPPPCLSSSSRDSLWQGIIIGPKLWNLMNKLTFSWHQLIASTSFSKSVKNNAVHRMNILTRMHCSRKRTGRLHMWWLPLGVSSRGWYPPSEHWPEGVRPTLLDIFTNFKHTHPSGHTHPTKRDLGPEIPTSPSRKNMGPGIPIPPLTLVNRQMLVKQESIPVGCVPPTCWPGRGGECCPVGWCCLGVVLFGGGGAV